MDILKSLPTIGAALFAGGALFTFILGLLSRHDRLRTERQAAVEGEEHENEVYRVAYRNVRERYVSLVTIVAPAVIAFKENQPSVASAMLDLVAHIVCEHRENSWGIKPTPDFLGDARRDLEAARVRRGAEAGEKA